jgi:hypothetical protein
MWVRALLGKEHQQAYLAERDRLIDDIKSGGASDDKMQDVAKAELAYIAAQTQKSQYDKLFGTRFGRWIEDEAHNL